MLNFIRTVKLIPIHERVGNVVNTINKQDINNCYINHLSSTILQSPWQQWSIASPKMVTIFNPCKDCLWYPFNFNIKLHWINEDVMDDNIKWNKDAVLKNNLFLPSKYLRPWPTAIFSRKPCLSRWCVWQPVDSNIGDYEFWRFGENHLKLKTSFWLTWEKWENGCC